MVCQLQCYLIRIIFKNRIADNDRNSSEIAETSKLQEQFDAQRARMKELYMLKEKECSYLSQKLQLLKKELDEKNSQLGN